ncbi:MAG: PQQ-binding-like beta-propeller repeat protein [Planctomyces sp.]|jgi:outer membrane protein assembly factor BamB
MTKPLPLIFFSFCLILHVTFLPELRTAAASEKVGGSGDWPQFRGADSRGVHPDSTHPDRWTTEENVAWKTDIPGRGWSSPILSGDRVYLTTVVNEGESEAPKKGLYFGGERKDPPKTNHQWRVLALDRSTGKILWNTLVASGVPESSIHIKNSYASETPVTDGRFVYAVFGNRGVYCLSIDGDLIWERPIGAKKTRLGWGTSASPVLYEDRLYIVNDNDEESSLAALDTKTGNEIWKISRDEKSNWATPYIWKNSLRTEIVTPGTERTRSYDLNGKLLYELGGSSSITIATPYEAMGLLIVSSGYVLDARKPIFAIRPGASGDISLKDDQTSNEFIAWCQKQAAPYNPTTLVHNDLLYVLQDRGFFACYDAKTGTPVFDRQRLPVTNFTSSPWAAGDRIFCVNEDGVTCVLQAGREYSLLHTNSLAEDDMCMATPALSSTSLFLRTASRLYCIEKTDTAVQQ